MVDTEDVVINMGADEVVVNEAAGVDGKAVVATVEDCITLIEELAEDVRVFVLSANVELVVAVAVPTRAVNTLEEAVSVDARLLAEVEVPVGMADVERIDHAYTSNLFPAPQYSNSLPMQSILQSERLTFVDPWLSVLPQ